MQIKNALKKIEKAGGTEIGQGENKWLRKFLVNGKEIVLGLTSANGCAGPNYEPEKVSSVKYCGDFYGITLTKALDWAKK